MKYRLKKYKRGYVIEVKGLFRWDSLDYLVGADGIGAPVSEPFLFDSEDKAFKFLVDHYGKHKSIIQYPTITVRQ